MLPGKEKTTREDIVNEWNYSMCVGMCSRIESRMTDVVGLGSSVKSGNVMSNNWCGSEIRDG